jgi:rubrerythrin
VSEKEVRAILETAVKIEEKSYNLYLRAKSKVERTSSKKFLDELAEEELEHKNTLLRIIENEDDIQKIGSQGTAIQDLKIVDFLQDVSLTEDADYQKILIFAAKREKATFEYYNSLTKGLEDTSAGRIFSKLAQEELRHKNKLEREYDEYILWQA